MSKLFSFDNGKSILRCSTCGLRSLRPLPDQAALFGFYNRPEYFKSDIAQLHDYLVRGYHESSKIIRLYKKHLQRIAMYKPPPAKILEIGCARGVLLDLARKAGYQVAGIEVNSYAAEYAQTEFGLPVQQRTLEEAVCEPQSQDIVVAYDVIEHLAAPRMLVAKAAEWLKPSGLLVLSTPDSHSLTYKIAETLAILGGRRFQYPIFRFYGRGVEHLNVFNKRNMSRILAEHGFVTLESYRYNIPLENLCDVGLVEKLVIGILMIHPYSFVEIARKTARSDLHLQRPG